MSTLETQPAGNISILNVGTKILLKDAMDQFLRTLGDFRTHYASNMAAALRAFTENTVHIMITELNLEDGSAYRLLQALGGTSGPGNDDLYVVIALEESTPAAMALIEELEAHAYLVKPFAANDLQALMKKYEDWKILPREPWQLLIQEAQLAFRDRRYKDADENYLEALKAAPQHPAPCYRAGVHFISKQDYATGEKLLLQSVEVNPKYTQALSALGEFYLKKQDFVKAEEYLRRAQQISPLNPDRPLHLVRAYAERSMSITKEALGIESGAIAGAPARLAMGKLLAFQRDYVGAIRELEKAIPYLKDKAKKEAEVYMALSKKLGGIAT